MINTDDAAAMFEACLIAHGYLHDSSRGGWANEVQNDIGAWYKLLGEDELQRQAIVVDILNAATNDWVRLYCARFLKNSFPELSDKVLSECENGGGAKAALAFVWRQS